MKKKLIFLQVSEARDKSNFIRKIQEFVQVPVLAKDSFDDVFDKLRVRFIGSPEDLKAVHELFDYYSERENHNVFDSEWLTIIPDPAIKMYAIFDLVTVK